MASRVRLILLALTVVACGSPTRPSDLVQLEVSEHIGPCLGNFRAGCTNVRTLPDGEWHPAELRGLRYREGTRLRIEAELSNRAPGSPHLVQEVWEVRRIVSAYRVPPA